MTKDEFKQWSIEYGYSVQDIARLLGISTHLVYAWRSGERKISPLALRALKTLKKRRGA